MSDGWGQDFDEDGNVIGEVPDDDPSFLDEHKYKLIAASGAIFLVNAPRAASGGPGAVVGALLVSAFVGALLVAGYVKLRG